MSDDQTQDQKTEQPTQRKLEKATSEGQIAFSTELIGGLAMLVGMTFFLFMGTWFFESIKDSIRERLLFMEPMISYPESILIAIRHDVTRAGVACMALMLPLVAVILLVGFLQTGFNLTTKPLTLDLSKVQPDKGFKRIFSTRSLNKGAVAIAKSSAIAVAVYFLTMAKVGEIISSGNSNFAHVLGVGTDLILAVGFLSAALMVIVGVIDFGFQKWKHNQEMMMTMQEIRDEHKETEGDPQIKARMRKMQNEMKKNRMLDGVSKATVVVTNPTHFAVALRYDPSESDAPIVLAKGADHLAKRIIELAKKNAVPVVERKPVARFLFANVEVGQKIPGELFQAVAEILNFIKRLEDRAA